MIRNLKALGLALVAAFALSAVVASAASAEFTSGSDSTTITATALNTQEFAIAGSGRLTCTEVGADDGTLGTAQTEITVTLTFGGHCTFNFPPVEGVTSEILTNGCHFLFTTHPTEPMHIRCETTGATQIEITALILGKFRKCLDISAQTPTNPIIDFRNGTNAATGKMDVELESTVTGLTYEGTGSCAFLGHANDMSYNGKITLTGHDSNGNPVDVTKSNGT